MAEDENGSPRAGASQIPTDVAHGLNEDELGDLTFAFQAIDLDSGGYLEDLELQAMISCLAQTDITVESVQDLIQKTKASFIVWLEPHDDDATLPEEMQVDHMEVHGEVGTIKHGAVRHHAALQIKPMKGKILEEYEANLRQQQKELMKRKKKKKDLKRVKSPLCPGPRPRPGPALLLCFWILFPGLP